MESIQSNTQTTLLSAEISNTNVGSADFHQQFHQIPGMSSEMQKLASFLYKPVSAKPTLDASINKKGQVQVKTNDGFNVTFLGRDEAFTITGPDGKTTKIWGDPHVKESDGDQWDFKNQSSFIFGNNKVTVQTVPSEHNGEVTYSQTVTVYNGDDRFTITGIDKNAPEILAWRLDGKDHDSQLEDGDIYQLQRSDGSEEWIKVETPVD